MADKPHTNAAMIDELEYMVEWLRDRFNEAVMAGEKPNCDLARKNAVAYAQVAMALFNIRAGQVSTPAAPEAEPELEQGIERRREQEQDGPDWEMEP